MPAETRDIRVHSIATLSERYFFSSTVYTFIFLLLFDDLEFFMILSEVEAESKEKEKNRPKFDITEDSISFNEEVNNKTEASAPRSTYTTTSKATEQNNELFLLPPLLTTFLNGPTEREREK